MTFSTQCQMKLPLQVGICLSRFREEVPSPALNFPFELDLLEDPGSQSDGVRNLVFFLEHIKTPRNNCSHMNGSHCWQTCDNVVQFISASQISMCAT